MAWSHKWSLLSPNKPSSSDTGYFQFICWPKESHRSEQTTQVVAKTMDCSSKTDNKTAFLKITPTKLIELGEVELVTMYNLHHHPVTLV